MRNFRWQRITVGHLPCARIKFVYARTTRGCTPVLIGALLRVVEGDCSEGGAEARRCREENETDPKATARLHFVLALAPRVPAPV